MSNLPSRRRVAVCEARAVRIDACGASPWPSIRPAFPGGKVGVGVADMVAAVESQASAPTDRRAARSSALRRVAALGQSGTQLIIRSSQLMSLTHDTLAKRNDSATRTASGRLRLVS